MSRGSLSCVARPRVEVLLLGMTMAACGADEPAAPQGGVVAETVVDGLDASIDATPHPFAESVYFLAERDGLFEAPMSGGTSSVVRRGAPFVRPRGLVFATSGQRIFVADPDAAGGGSVFDVARDGTSVAVLPGTEGLAPQGVTIAGRGADEALYFTGTSSGTPGVFRLTLAAGPIERLASGAPLVRPDGIAVGPDGRVWVTDTGARSLFVIDGGVATAVQTGLTLGSPAGVELSLEGQVVLVSALDPTAGTSQVLVYDVLEGSTTIFDDHISRNRSSGGLHRAHDADVFAWADGEEGTLGEVILVSYADERTVQFSPKNRFRGGCCRCSFGGDQGTLSAQQRCLMAGGGSLFCGICCGD